MAAKRGKRNLTKNLKLIQVRAQLMPLNSKCESTLARVFLQLAPIDVLGQAVGYVVLLFHFDDGQLSSLDLLLYPQFSYFIMSTSPSTSP